MARLHRDQCGFSETRVFEVLMSYRLGGTRRNQQFVNPREIDHHHRQPLASRPSITRYPYRTSSPHLSGADSVLIKSMPRLDSTAPTSALQHHAIRESTTRRLVTLITANIDISLAMLLWLSSDPPLLSLVSFLVSPLVDSSTNRFAMRGVHSSYGLS